MREIRDGDESEEEVCGYVSGIARTPEATNVLQGDAANAMRLG